MMKIILVIALCGFVLAYGQGYDAAAQDSKNAANNHGKEEGVSGGQSESQNAPSDDQEINHEFSFSGKSINRPEPPPVPAARGDGPAPASYPPLTPHGINVGNFGGKGGFEEKSGAAPPAAASHPSPSAAPGSQKSDGYKHKH